MDAMPPGELLTADLPPVERLMSLGEPAGWETEEWADYIHEFGLDQQHVPELIRILSDMTLYELPEKSPERWAPIHAWRALGQLRAEEAAPALAALLIDLAEDLDAVELMTVLGMIGPAAIPPLIAQLAERDHALCVSEIPAALAEIGERHPQARDRCVEVLVAILQEPEADRTLVGRAVSAMIDLHAVESIDAIRDAFARDGVDLQFAGDLEDVEIELGLRTQRDTPKPRYHSWPFARSIADEDTRLWRPQTPVRVEKIGRNEPCPCGSGRKYKKCCLD